MNLLDRAKQIAHGVPTIVEWLGSGGIAVEPDVAQARADVCLKCPHNVDGLAVTEIVAKAIKRHLRVKNGLAMTVYGAKKLKTCDLCGCVLNLLIWQPQDKVSREMTDDEKSKAPGFCWKLKQ